MKKYLIFGISSRMGGVESFVINYVSAIQDKDNHFELILFDTIPDFLEKTPLRACKKHVVPSRTKNPILFYLGMKKILKEGNYDILWYNVCTLSDITLLKLAKKYWVPTRVVHSHAAANMAGKLVGILHEKHKKELEKYATDYFACSQMASEFMFPKTVLDKKVVQIINNAINAKKYSYNELIRENARKSLGIKEELLVGHVGRFHFQKNHAFLIEVMKHVIRMDRAVKLLLVGEGELKKQIIAQVKQAGIEKNVIFLEKRTDINELMQAMDVFVFPSIVEGLGLVLVEAQAADLPCVLSDTIPNEVYLTSKLFPMSLSDSAEKWAVTILQSAKDKKRVNQYPLVLQKGFDIYDNAEQLKEYFQNR